MSCNRFNPDNIFRRFKVIECPKSFAGLSSIQKLEVNMDLNVSAYFKTFYEGHLMNFNDAQNISAAHKAFNIEVEDDLIIKITFNPTNECISKAKHDKNFNNIFIIDLRLININEMLCCYNELHAEIGRYYICGQFEHNTLNHSPNTIEFGDVVIYTKAKKYLQIRNEANQLSAKMQFIKIAGVDVAPATFTISPKSFREITVTIRPTSLVSIDIIEFKVINTHHVFDEQVNFLKHTVKFHINVVYKNFLKLKQVESLHKLYEQNPAYTFVGEELTIHKTRQENALISIKSLKKVYAVQPILEKYSTDKNTCFVAFLHETKVLSFCQTVEEMIPIYDVFLIQINPITVDFGRVGSGSSAESTMTIQNDTKFNINVQFLKDVFMLYTENKKSVLNIRLASFSCCSILVCSTPRLEGNYSGYFQYSINNKFVRRHTYSLHVGTPTLTVNEKSLKFGMITAENFVTSVPIKLFNNFNLNIDFKWDDLQTDIPFEIIPKSGTVAPHSSKICDAQYICKITKSKTYEIDLLTTNNIPRSIPFEFNIISRKLSIKFLQESVSFKDVGLNLESIKKVKLENTSREIAVFLVLEPLIPGVKIEPMCGTIRPKMIMSFDIIIQIPCLLEFAFDVIIKINNKENIILPVTGNVVEPKLLINPKTIYMPRIPSYMISYVPVTLQNLSNIRTTIEILDTGDDNVFHVYVLQCNQHKRIYEFNLEGGETKSLFIKIYDIFRREYDMYLPFKINGLLGPPNQNLSTTELQYYTKSFERSYENNNKVKILTIQKDVSFCRIIGVITLPWIEFSMEKFEVEYIPNTENVINFSMTNVSKFYFYVTILTSKLPPVFTLKTDSNEIQADISENYIKFDLNCGKEVQFTLKFHPKSHGTFISTALLYLDKLMSIPYYNLTFVGKRKPPDMFPSTFRIVFPPCHVGKEISALLTLQIEGQLNNELLSSNAEEEPHLKVHFIDSTIVESGTTYTTNTTVKIVVLSETSTTQNTILHFQHENGSGCEVEVCFCVTNCPLTLHNQLDSNTDVDPYPYYPLDSQAHLFNYMENCRNFLEKWMFQQGFRRDLYPIIPDTFHAISSSISSQTGYSKSKGINITYLSFMRRIAGPLMKHIKKITVVGENEASKHVIEIHNTYKEIIYLLKSRGANLWFLQAKFLLSFEQFVIYSASVPCHSNADIFLINKLLTNVSLFNRLNKQSWIDFILQSYKVFVLDSCFFDCVCVSVQPRDIIKIIIDWYNENILKQHNVIRSRKRNIKIVNNITTDLADGVALISVILNYCPFMAKHFQLFCDTYENNNKDQIINNGCLIIEAINILRIYFPLNSKDLLEPNFLQMLFLSVHLYIVLPTFIPKGEVELSPPLLKSSSRLLTISSSTQESLIYSFVILNNTKTNFSIEKVPSPENGKRVHLSVKYTANFIAKETAVLLIHGYNKTRLFDTYVIFILQGKVGALNPFKKCKITGPLYRPNKADVLIASPFTISASFNLYLNDVEPELPIRFETKPQQKYYLTRLHLIEKTITLNGVPKETGQEIQEQKLHLQIICLNCQIGNTWLWFRSEIGEFFIRITTQPRWDLAADTLEAKVLMWPLDPCSCGETCECYRTTVVMIPHQNEQMIKSLRYALAEETSEVMMEIFDLLIESALGRSILLILLKEGGTNLSDVQHILRNSSTFRITSRALLPKLDKITLSHHSSNFLPLPITIPADDRVDKYSITLTSECGMDIRTYRVVFRETISE